MAIVKVCPPGAGDPGVIDTRVMPTDHRRKTLWDDMPLAQQTELLAFHEQHPYEQVQFDFHQSGPFAIPGDAQIVISMAYLQVRSVLREQTTENPEPNPPYQSIPVPAGPCVKLADTFIVPRRKGYSITTPNYKPIKPEDMDPKVCYYQDEQTGQYYSRAGTKGKYGGYAYQTTYAYILAGGVIYPLVAHGYYLREPKPGAVPVTFTKFSNAQQVHIEPVSWP